MKAQSSAPITKISDAQATAALVRGALEMTQNIYSGTVYPAANPILQNVLLKNVGVVKRLIVEVVATIQNNGVTTAATLTDIGLANLISNVTFYDLNNNLRINTTGAHLALLSNVKRHRNFASTADYNQSDSNNVASMFNVPPSLWPVLQAPASIAAGASATVRAVFEIPLAYSDDDLRGAIYANVINSNMNLSITFNNNLFVQNGDETNAVYSGNTGTFTSAVVNIYQVYLDQLPQLNGKYVLPMESLSTIYELKNTTLTGIAANQDFPIPFANFRYFFSAFLLYNSTGAAGGRVLGTDINYLSRTTANTTQVFKYDPLYSAMLTRNAIQNDLPKGLYYLNFRRQPILTNQYGNQQINLNANTAGAGAYVNMFWEDMAFQNSLNSAASLP